MINKVILIGILESDFIKVYGKKIKSTYITIATQNFKKTKIITLKAVVFYPLLKKLLDKKNIEFLKNNFCTYYGYLIADKEQNVQVVINDIVFVAKGDDF